MVKNNSAIQAFGQKNTTNIKGDNFGGKAEITNQDEIQISAQKHETKKYSTVPWYPPTPELKRQLKQLAIDEDKSMSKLITEGLKYVFEKRGKSISDYL